MTTTVLNGAYSKSSRARSVMVWYLSDLTAIITAAFGISFTTIMRAIVTAITARPGYGHTGLDGHATSGERQNSRQAEFNTGLCLGCS